jgi:hypothetical protein
MAASHGDPLDPRPAVTHPDDVDHIKSQRPLVLPRKRGGGIGISAQDRERVRLSAAVGDPKADLLKAPCLPGRSNLAGPGETSRFHKSMELSSRNAREPDYLLHLDQAVGVMR